MAKRCAKCREEKSFDSFHQNASRSDGKHHTCKKCHNRDVNERKYMTEYGLTRDEAMTLKSRGCEVCGTTEGIICIDHDHETGAVRGALCVRHNAALGMCRDSASELLAVAAYAISHERVFSG